MHEQLAPSRELGPGAHHRQQFAEQLIAVVAGNGVCPAELYEAHLCQTEPDSTYRQIASSVCSAESRPASVDECDGSGVLALDTAQAAVDAESFRRFSPSGSERTDVRVIPECPLSSQIDAHAVTWLGLQAFSECPDLPTADDPI